MMFNIWHQHRKRISSKRWICCGANLITRYYHLGVTTWRGVCCLFLFFRESGRCCAVLIFRLLFNPSPPHDHRCLFLSPRQDYLDICFSALRGKYSSAVKYNYAANVALCGPGQRCDVMWTPCCLMSVSGEGRYMSSVPPANPERCPSLSASLTPPVMTTKTHTRVMKLSYIFMSWHDNKCRAVWGVNTRSHHDEVLLVEKNSTELVKGFIQMRSSDELSAGFMKTCELRWRKRKRKTRCTHPGGWCCASSSYC